MPVVSAAPMQKPCLIDRVAPSSRRPRCLIVDDHRLFADLLVMTLAAAPDLAIDIVPVAPSVKAGIAACDSHRPDVVLLAVNLRDGSGIDVAEHVAATLPKTRVIVLSRQTSLFDCPPHVSRAVHAVIDKAQPLQDLQVMLADLCRPRAERGRPNALRHNRRELTGVLSTREREVLALIGQPLTSTEVAKRLGVSLHTISAHRKNIARKLGIRGTNLALVAYEYREQLTRHR